MYYEDVRVTRHETLSSLLIRYGHAGFDRDAENVINDPRNSNLRQQLLARSRRARQQPRPGARQLEIGDLIQVPIDWRIDPATGVTLAQGTDGVSIRLERTGGPGTQLNWCQTVQRNLRVGSPILVDPTDQGIVSADNDELPFYYSEPRLLELAGRRRVFEDHPFRPAIRTTRGIGWRAVVSIAVATERRVTLCNSIYWGFDMSAEGLIAPVPTRLASVDEIDAHLRALMDGHGSRPGMSFSQLGWSFRVPVPQVPSPVPANPGQRSNTVARPRQQPATVQRPH